MEADGPLGKDFDETCASVKIAIHSLKGPEDDNLLYPKQIYEKLHKISPRFAHCARLHGQLYTIRGLDLPKMHF